MDDQVQWLGQAWTEAELVRYVRAMPMDEYAVLRGDIQTLLEMLADPEETERLRLREALTAAQSEEGWEEGEEG